jgi:hypothetical protein
MKKTDEEKNDAKSEVEVPVKEPETEAPKKVLKASKSKQRPGMIRVRMLDTGKVTMYGSKTAKALISRKRAERVD